MANARMNGKGMNGCNSARTDTLIAFDIPTIHRFEMTTVKSQSSEHSNTAKSMSKRTIIVEISR